MEASTVIAFQNAKTDETFLMQMTNCYQTFSVTRWTDWKRNFAFWCKINILTNMFPLAIVD